MKDHRQIAKELDLFSASEYAPGAIFWHPKGWTIYRLLQDFIRQKIEADGYMEISTPVMVKSSLFEKSGHLKHYKENMFNLVAEKEDYSLKPMNCPESTLIYSSKTRSYHDLPIKLSEFGILHRNELSGVLGGAFRVRQFVIDDAHLFLRPDQIQEEIHKLILLVMDVYKTFNFDTKFFLSTRPDKAMGDEKTWNEAETDLKKALTDAKVDFDIKEKDGAFYGPKIDVQIKDSQDRDWQLATIQLDFQIPEKMKLTYVDRDGKEQQPVMIHRGIFGSLERFIGILIEHFQGSFPIWLSPVQAIVLPLSDKFTPYANKVATELRSSKLRVEVDSRNETLQAKIRDASLQKIPYILVVGAKEEEAKKIAIRNRQGENLGLMSLAEFLEKISQEVAAKS